MPEPGPSPRDDERLAVLGLGLADEDLDALEDELSNRVRADVEVSQDPATVWEPGQLSCVIVPADVQTSSLVDRIPDAGDPAWALAPLVLVRGPATATDRLAKAMPAYTFTSTGPDPTPSHLAAMVETTLAGSRFRRDHRASEHALFDSLPIGVFQTTAEGAIVEANRSLAELLGYPDVATLKEANARDFYVDPDDRQRWRDQVEAEDQITEIETQLERWDGETVWVELRARRLERARGEAVYEGTVMDVTDRRLYKQELETNQRRLRALLESTPDAMVIVDAEGTIRTVNEGTEDLFGYGRAELVGEPVELLVPDDVREDHVDDREAYVDDPERRPMGLGLDLRGRHQDGSEIPVEISLSPVQLEDELFVAAAVRDVREQRAIEEGIRLLQRTPARMSQAQDSNEALEIALQAVCEATGWRLAEAWTRDDALELRSLWHDPDERLARIAKRRRRERLDEDRCLAGRVLDSGEIEWIRDVENQDGAVPRAPAVEAGLNAQVALPVDVEGETAVAMLFHMAEATVEDERFVEVLESLAAQVGSVLAQKKAEQALRVRTQELEAANEELQAFAQAASHDLREPVRTVEGLTHQLLQRHVEDLDDRGEFLLERVQAASHRLGDLLSSLERLTRISQAELEPREIDLADLAREVVDDLRDEDPDHPGQVEITTNATVEADPGLVRLVLRNLIENAWKYTRSETAPQIEIGTDRTDDGPVHYVSDTGPGFDPEHADQLFEPFQRMPQHADHEEGSGIGLATVERIVRRHDGEVWAQSPEEEGATFFFTLDIPRETALES